MAFWRGWTHSIMPVWLPSPLIKPGASSFAGTHATTRNADPRSPGASAGLEQV
jgi:hypothetical protein